MINILLVIVFNQFSVMVGVIHFGLLITSCALTKNLVSHPPFFIRAACSKEPPHLQPCPSTLPPPLQPQSLFQILPLFFNFVLNLSFNSSLSSSTLPSTSLSTLLRPWLNQAKRPALQAEPVAHSEVHDEEAGWTIVSSKKSQQKKAKQLIKHGVPSLQSI